MISHSTLFCPQCHHCPWRLGKSWALSCMNSPSISLENVLDQPFSRPTCAHLSFFPHPGSPLLAPGLPAVAPAAGWVQLSGVDRVSLFREVEVPAPPGLSFPRSRLCDGCFPAGRACLAPARLGALWVLNSLNQRSGNEPRAPMAGPPPCPNGGAARESIPGVRRLRGRKTSPPPAA